MLIVTYGIFNVGEAIKLLLSQKLINKLIFSGKGSGVGDEREHLASDPRLRRRHRPPSHPRRSMLPVGQSLQRIGSSLVLLGHEQPPSDDDVLAILADGRRMFLHSPGNFISKNSKSLDELLNLKRSAVKTYFPLENNTKQPSGLP